MTQNRIVEAAREALYAALTAPPLQYKQQDGSTATLPPANVIPRNIWEIGPDAVPPIVALGVAIDRNSRVPETIARASGERSLALKLTVISSASQAEAVSIADELVTLIDFADQEGSRFTRDLSRAGTATTQPIVVRDLSVTQVSDPEIESATSRYVVTIEAQMIAA